METSAKTGENIEELFSEIGKYCILLDPSFRKIFGVITVETCIKEPRFFLGSLDRVLSIGLVVSIPS